MKNHYQMYHRLSVLWRNVRQRAIGGFAAIALTLMASMAFAQERTVTGKVTDVKDSAPLPGVNILLKGTNRGTVTDANGEFRLSASTNDVLVFSQIGYESQEVTIGAQSTITISLKESTSVLNEVVVTALGISQEKRSLGYSIQEVRGDELSQTQRPNFMASLQGRVAGLSITTTSGMPGASASITLRGVSSISNNNQPLIVVDGLPIDNTTFDQHNLYSNLDNRNNDYTNRAADINPNDIASVTVLKGPEAAALYGQDAASGVIIITTKKGTRGGGGKVTYDNSIGFQKVYRFPKTQTTYGLGNFGFDDPAVSETQFLGTKIPEGTELYDNKNKFFQTGVSQIHNLGMEGGMDQATYRFSVNYTNQKGTVPTNEYTKLSARLTSSLKISPKLEATTTFNYILANNIKPVRGPNGFLMGVLSWPAYDDISNYLNADGTRRTLTTPTPVSTSVEVDNPFFSIYKNHNSDKTNRVMGNMTMNFNPLDWLNFTGVFGADIYSTVGDYFLHPEGINGIARGGALDTYTENSRLLNGQFRATAKKNFGDFKTSLMVGTTFDDKNYETNSLYGEKFLLKEFNSINNTTLTTQRTFSTLSRRRLVSVISQANVNYKDLVYFTLSGRNDWSSTMPIENRSFFYPSTSLSFVFTELEALKDLPVLSYGKLRASYANVGKDVAPYKIAPRLVAQTTTGGGFAYDFFAGNPALKPERTKAWEFGTELKLYNGRIGLDVAYYKKDLVDQLATQRLSYGTGFIFGLLNSGDISVKGVDIQLKGSPIVTNDFEWNILVNFSKSKSKVIQLPAAVSEYYNSDTWLLGNARGSAFPSNLQDFFSTATNSNYANYNFDYMQRGLGSATAIGGVTYERNSNGDILINPTSGLPQKTSDFLPIGDRNPAYSIGLTNSLTYKNFGLSFLFDIRKGMDIFNGNEMYLFQKGLSQRILDRETPYIFKGVLKDGNQNSATPTPNTIAVLPYTLGSTFYGAFAESDFVEHNIYWFRLRDVTLSYSLPSAKLSNQKIIKSASIFTTMTDLFLKTNYSGADPMVNGTSPATSGAGAAGIDFGTLALPRTITFGVKVGL